MEIDLNDIEVTTHYAPISLSMGHGIMAKATHKPTGLFVEWNKERSVYLNKHVALQKLIAHLEHYFKENNMKKPHKHAEVIKAWADGAVIQILTGGVWKDAPNPHWHEENAYRIKPEREYPKSTLTDTELVQIYNSLHHTTKQMLRDVADAAVKRYVQEEEAKERIVT